MSGFCFKLSCGIVLTKLAVNINDYMLLTSNSFTLEDKQAVMVH